MQKSIRVYRWQHKELGIGPLCGELNFQWRLHFREHNYPCDDENYCVFERKTEDVRGIFFAWSSLSLLINNMYDDAEEALEEEGFELTEWEVDEGDFVLMEDGQVAFLKHKARRIN